MRNRAIEPRVLHVDTERTWRGGEQQMLYLLRGLAGRGLAARAVCQSASAAAQRCREAGVEVHRVPMKGEADLPAALEIARLARRTRSNILHAHTAHAQALAWLAARLFLARCRIVAHRRIEFPVGRGLFGLGRLKYLAGPDAFIAVSHRVRETLVEAGVPAWKVFVVHSVTDPERFSLARAHPSLRSELGIPFGAFVVGNVGYLVAHKDHLNLLEASRLVRDQIPDLWVVIVGEGPLREEILQKARSLQVADRLVLTGFRTDIPQLIRMFDLFVLSSSEEGICSSVLDAMASGRPVVATDAGGVREAVIDGETGLIVPIKDPVALAGAVLKMARSPEMARRMAMRGKERALKFFTPEVLTEKTLQVYRRALQGRVGPEFAPD